MARPTRANLRAKQRRGAQAARSTRRLPATAADAVSWKLEGGDGLNADTEAPAPEVFGAAGVLSRPDGAPEAIVVAIGGDGHDAIVATRDYAWAVASGAAGMPIGETWLFNRRAFVRIRADGSIDIGRPDGTFEAVATTSHRHAAGGDPVPLTVTSAPGAVAGFTGPAITNAIGRGIASRVRAETGGV